MAKFGELIQSNVPVLILFYSEWNEESTVMKQIIKDIASAFGNNLKVIGIDIDKNDELADALRIKNSPTMMIYDNQQMVWRFSGEMPKEDIVALLEPYLL